MNWSILSVSIPVHDLEKSKSFYQLLFPYNEKQESYYQSMFKKEESIFFGNKGLGLRLFKPKPDLELKNMIQSRKREREKNIVRKEIKYGNVKIKCV